MRVQTALELSRIFVVMALVAYAAVLLTPKNRLPLALRGLAKLLGKETLGRGGDAPAGVTFGKRLWGMLLIAFAFALAVIRL